MEEVLKKDGLMKTEIMDDPQSYIGVVKNFSDHILPRTRDFMDEIENVSFIEDNPSYQYKFIE
jgi:hypothetical protein